MRPVPVLSTLDAAFPASVIGSVLPQWDELPEEYRKNWHRSGANKWVDFVSTWFSIGVDVSEWKPKEGVDLEAAQKALRAVLGSFEPKHEHKIAGCAFLAAEWFDDIKWKPAERKPKP